MPSLTPSAAVGSSRITTLLPNAADRATATPWRWPPDSVSTACPMFWMVAMPSSVMCRLASARMCLRSSMRKHRAERARLALLAAEEQVVGDVEAGCDRERLVDGLDAGVARLHRVLEVHGLAVEQDLALVRHERAGQALISARLAGAVVADDGRGSRPGSSSKSQPSIAVTRP